MNYRSSRSSTYDFPAYGKTVMFSTEFVVFLHSMKQNKLEEMASAWRNFKNIFTRPLFTIIFMKKIVFLGTDSILKVKTMYESVKKDVLSHGCHGYQVIEIVYK